MTRAEIRTLLVKAREAEMTKRTLVDNLFNFLEDRAEIHLDDIPNISAENADTLAEAIMCHINYGECDIEDLLDDIERCFSMIPEERQVNDCD